VIRTTGPPAEKSYPGAKGGTIWAKTDGVKARNNSPLIIPERIPVLEQFMICINVGG
jgi:hypothetical protein